jgi:membrane protease subunit HflK
MAESPENPQTPQQPDQPNPEQPGQGAEPTQASSAQPGRPEELPEMDPAQQSMADALNISFKVLQVVMVGLLIFYAFSNVFTVKANERAIRLTFGQISGAPGEQIIESGNLHFAWPYPIQQVIKFKTSTQDVMIDERFWYELAEGERGQTSEELAQTKSGPLNPEKDGFLLTGDANIVHIQASVTYTVNDPVSFIRNVGDPRDDTSMMRSADDLVRVAAERSVIHTIAGLSADRVYQGLTEEHRRVFRDHLSRTLDELGSGIAVQSVSFDNQAFPFAVRQAFQSALDAENQRQERIVRARQERDRILNELAGEAHEPLWALIQDYQLATAEQDKPALDQLTAELSDAFDDLKIGELPIGGQIAQKINDARSYKTEVVQSLLAEKQVFQAHVDAWDTTPRRLLENNLWQKTREQIFSNAAVETFYMPSGAELYLEGNRDPRFRKAREEAMLAAQEQAQRDAED